MIKFCKTALEKAPWNPFDVCNFCKNIKCKWENKDDNPKYIGEHYTSIDDENEGVKNDRYRNKTNKSYL